MLRTCQTSDVDLCSDSMHFARVKHARADVGHDELMAGHMVLSCHEVIDKTALLCCCMHHILLHAETQL